MNKIGSFSPSRYPGPHIDKHSLRMKNTALDFSSLYFDQQLIEKIVRHTNEYAHNIMNKSISQPVFARMMCRLKQHQQKPEI